MSAPLQMVIRMNVFISWSDDRSRTIGLALYDWLPTIIQGLKCWMSEHNIEKGTRSMPVLSQELEQAQFGIVCLVPENLLAPWLLFEAGALSKSTTDSRVWTFLYGLEHTDVVGPLSQFQHTKANKEDVRKLLHAMNRAQGELIISTQQLDIAFERGWDELEQRLNTVPANLEQAQSERNDRDLLKEILELSRAQNSQNQLHIRLLDELLSGFRSMRQNPSSPAFDGFVQMRSRLTNYGDTIIAPFSGAGSLPSTDIMGTPPYKVPPRQRASGQPLVTDDPNHENAGD